MAPQRRIRVAIVGGGICESSCRARSAPAGDRLTTRMLALPDFSAEAGIAQAVRLQEALGDKKAEVTIYERSNEAGGVWRDSRWAGAA